MLIKRLFEPVYLNKDEGTAAGGDKKPAGDPPGGNPSSLDPRDAYVQELKQEAVNHRLKAKAAEDKVLELTGQVAQLTTRMQEQETKFREASLRSSVITAAASAGFHDPADAWNMLDKAAVKLAEGGTVEGLEEALKKISDSKPYLLKGATPGNPPPATPPPAKPQPSAGNPGKTSKLTVEAIAKMTPQEIAKRLSTDPDFVKQVEEAQRST